MLELTDLTIGYQGREIQRIAALHLAKGAQCLITGPSGCGKTTLLYTIAGLIPALSGSIRIHGTNIAPLSESARDQFRGQHLGIVFQTLHLVKSLTVLDNLLLASYVAGLPPQRARAGELLARLGIADKAHELPDHLSQGQQQRVAIARAMLHRPALVLADEPTSSLDDEAAETVIALLKQAAQESEATLLISTHDSRVKAHFSHVVSLGVAA